MYSTCIFCNSRLGANAVVEEHAVGRRLAFEREWRDAEEIAAIADDLLIPERIRRLLGR